MRVSTTTGGWEVAIGSPVACLPSRKFRGFAAFGRVGSATEPVPDDVLVLELLQQRYLPNRGGRHALLLLLQPDALERHDLVRDAVAGLIHHPVRPLADLLHLLEVVHRRGDAPGGCGGRRGHRASTPRRAQVCPVNAIREVDDGIFFKPGSRTGAATSARAGAQSENNHETFFGFGKETSYARRACSTEALKLHPIVVRHQSWSMAASPLVCDPGSLGFPRQARSRSRCPPAENRRDTPPRGIEPSTEPSPNAAPNDPRPPRLCSRADMLIPPDPEPYAEYEDMPLVCVPPTTKSCSNRDARTKARRAPST